MLGKPAAKQKHPSADHLARFSAALHEIVDQPDLPCHHCPMDRLIAALVSRMEQFGLFLQQRAYASRVAGFDGGSDGRGFGHDVIPTMGYGVAKQQPN